MGGKVGNRDERGKNIFEGLSATNTDFGGGLMLRTL